LTLKKYLEDNKFAEANITPMKEGVKIEFALISRKKNKKWVVSVLSHETININGKNLEEVSEKIIALAIQKLNFELPEKDYNELEKITRKIEAFENGETK